MSTYWPAGATPIVTDQPRLHALVIGVSRYPHLIGGGGDPAQDQLMLGQVTTPAYTAREIAGWLTTGYGNPACPLGSVELLLSDDQPAVAGAGPATMASIGQAVKRWRDRCSTQPDNIALFYFCGHGLAKDEQYLLPEDFGDPALAGPWQNCIDFEGLRLGLRSECAARTQVFFVDACRETPFNVLTQVNVHGESLAGGRRFASGVRTQATYYATGEEKQAYGPATGKTYFAEAVLRCLSGLAAANTRGTWEVSTHSLAAALGHVMERQAAQYKLPLQSHTDVQGLPAVLHTPCQPAVLVSLQCSSPAATTASEIELRGYGQSHRAGLTDPKPLTREVAPGQWEVVVTFPNQEYAASNPIPCFLMPPTYDGVPYP